SLLLPGPLRRPPVVARSLAPSGAARRTPRRADEAPDAGAATRGARLARPRRAQGVHVRADDARPLANVAGTRRAARGGRFRDRRDGVDADAGGPGSAALADLARERPEF